MVCKLVGHLRRGLETTSTTLLPSDDFLDPPLPRLACMPHGCLPACLKCSVFLNLGRIRRATEADDDEGVLPRGHRAGAFFAHRVPSKYKKKKMHSKEHFFFFFF